MDFCVSTMMHAKVNHLALLITMATYNHFYHAVPSLQQVCALTIISEGLDYSMLPPRLQHIV